MFVVVSRQSKNALPRRSLWFDSAHHPESIEGRLRGEQIINNRRWTQTLYSDNMAKQNARGKLLHKYSIHCSDMARYTLSIVMQITCGLQIESTGASAG